MRFKSRFIGLYALLFGASIVACAIFATRRNADLVAVKPHGTEVTTVLVSEVEPMQPSNRLRSRRFTITNEFYSKVQLDLVGVSCGCLSVSANDHPWRAKEPIFLSHYESTVIEIAIPLILDSGLISYDAYVCATAKTRRQDIPLRCAARLVEDVVPNPRTLHHTFDRGTMKSTAFTIRVDRTYRSLSVGGDPVAWSPRLEDPPPGIIQGTAMPVGEVQQFDDKCNVQHWELPIFVEPSCEWNGVVVIPNALPYGHGRLFMSITKKRAINHPTHVDFGTMAIGEKRLRHIHLESTDKQEFCVVEVESISSRVKCRWDRKLRSARHGIVLEYEPKTRSETPQRITITTDHSTDDKVVIDLSGTAVEL